MPGWWSDDDVDQPPVERSRGDPVTWLLVAVVVTGTMVDGAKLDADRVSTLYSR